MANFYIIRLGADSENEIRKLDACTEYTLRQFTITVQCKQVPSGVHSGDFAIIWLGTNNNKGGKTSWIQGVRALGAITKIFSYGGYNEPTTIHVEIGVVLPRSVSKVEIITRQSALYPLIVEMPVLGPNNYSSQVVQRINLSEPGQSMPALFAALEAILPGFAAATIEVYPDLEAQFKVVSPSAAQTKLASEDEIFKDAQDIKEDDDGLELDEGRGVEIEVPFDPSKIDIIAKSMTISNLEARLVNTELDLTPDFQRQANVWDGKRKARLIESILLRIPLPSFYFSEDAEGGYAVVDGLQRLCAVFHFKHVELLNEATGAELQPLKLQGLQYLKELENKTFAELERKFQRRISELEITANVIRANTPSAVKFNVFARLNQGGMPLNAQEIRNAIFPGEWRNEIRKLAESQVFIQGTDGKVQTARQQDMELILRFVALWQLGPPHHRPSNFTLDEFLNTTVEHELCNWSSSEWMEATCAFEQAMKAAKMILGKHAFRKSTGLQSRKPINRGLFEAELIVLGALDEQLLEIAASRRETIESRLADALESNESFIRALLYATGSAEASNTRIDALSQLVKEVIHA
jgi:hypothetical protein